MTIVIDRLTQHVQVAVAPLRVVLVLLFALLVVLQTFSFPGQFRHMAETEPENAHLRWPLTIVAALVIACVQVVVVSIWKLLAMVRDDRIFTDRAFAWVDAIIIAITAGWLLVAGTLALALRDADDPGPVVMATLIVLVGAVLALLMVVMRALLWRATNLRSEMESVI